MFSTTSWSGVLIWVPSVTAFDYKDRSEAYLLKSGISSALSCYIPGNSSAMTRYHHLDSQTAKGRKREYTLGENFPLHCRNNNFSKKKDIFYITSSVWIYKSHKVFHCTFSHLLDDHYHGPSTSELLCIHSIHQTCVISMLRLPQRPRVVNQKRIFFIYTARSPTQSFN